MLGTICSIDMASERAVVNQYPWYWPYGLPSLMRLSNQSEGIRTCSCAFAFPSTYSPSHSGTGVPSSSGTLESTTKQRHMPIEGMRLWQTDDAPAFVVLNPHAGADLLRSAIA